MVRLCQPFRKRQPATGGLGPGPRRDDLKRLLRIAEHGRHPGLHQGSGVLIVAASIDIGRGRLTPVPECHESRFGLPSSFLSLNLIGRVRGLRTSLEFVNRFLNVGLQLQPALPFGSCHVGQIPISRPGTQRPTEPVQLGLQPVVLVIGPFKQCHETVIVTLRDRVELMGVAPCTLEGQPHDSRAQDINDVRHDVQPVGNIPGQIGPGRIR